MQIIITFVARKQTLVRLRNKGKMPEWSNGPHSKCGVRVTVPGVRIPLFPPKTNRTARYGTYHKGNLQVILKLPLHFKEFPQGTYLPATALPRENEPGKTVPHSAKRYRYLSGPAFRMRKGRPVPTDSAPAFIRPTKYGKRSTATETRAGTRLPEDYFMP